MSDKKHSSQWRCLVPLIGAFLVLWLGSYAVSEAPSWAKFAAVITTVCLMGFMVIGFLVELDDYEPKDKQ